jgi:mannan endo-1,4-beta-mannosidase
MYEEYSTSAAGQAHVTTALGQAGALHLPLVVGEFGGMAAGLAVASPLILSECARLGLGYIPWSWKGNDTNLAYLDMAVDWQGQTLTAWGMSVIQGTYGISTTAHPASIFAP